MHTLAEAAQDTRTNRPQQQQQQQVQQQHSSPTLLHFQHQCLPQFVQVILLQPSFFMVAMPQTGQLLLAVAMNLRFMAWFCRSRSRKRSSAVVPRRRRPKMRTRCSNKHGQHQQQQQQQQQSSTPSNKGQNYV
jgi:hypothetical protein